MILLVVVALGWGVIAGGAVLGLAYRIEVTRRTRAISTRSKRRLRARIGRWIVRMRAVDTTLRVFGSLRRRTRARRDEETILRALPIAVDVLGVSVGSGATPYHAVCLAARWSPPRLASVFEEVVRAMSVGSSFDDALRAAGRAAPVVRPLTETLRTSARLGAPAAASLSRLAQEVRDDVRRRAEARARTVPVRLLFPLVLCVLPAFVVLTVVPVLLDGISF